MRILLFMMGIAFLLMWAAGLIFQIPGLFIWFLLGLGLAAVILGFRAQHEM